MKRFGFLLAILVLLGFLSLRTCSKSRHHNIGSTKRIRDCWIRCETLYQVCQQRENVNIKAFLMCKLSKKKCGNNCKIKKRKKKYLKKTWENSFV